MSLRTKLAGMLLGKDVNERLQQAIHTTTLHGGARRNTAALMQMYRTSPWLQAVTKKIGQRFASVTWELYAAGSTGKWRDPGQLKEMGFEDRQKRIAELKQAGELVRIEVHPLLAMLNNANPMMTGSSGRMLTQIYRDIPGEAFWALGINALGAPTEFWPVPPNWVTAIPDGPDGSYELTVSGSRFPIPKDQMIWFRDPDPANPYGRGAGTAESLTDEIETDEYAAQFIKTFFRNRGKPELMVFLEGLDEGELKEAKQKFENQHQGFGRAHRSWFYNTKMDVKELTQKFTDMELSDLRKDERDTIINVFGVPPEQLGIVTSSNRATAFESENIMSKSVLVPRLEPFREQLQAELVPRYDDRLILDYVSPIPADRLFQLEVMKAAPYMFERADWRTLGGASDRGKGDQIHLQPMNLLEVPAPTADSTGSSNIRALLPEHKANKGVDAQGMIMILDALRPERINVEVVPVWNDELQEWGDRTLADLNLEASFDMLNPMVTDHMAEFTGTRIVGINDQSRILIQQDIIAGTQAGEGFRDMATRLTERFDWMGQTRAETIARTESVRSSSFGSVESYAQSGIVEVKRWIVTPDGQRHDAAGYGGAIADIRADFIFDDGASSDYPGNFGVAWQDINCRCAVAPVVEGADAPTREWMDQHWKAEDAERRSWEASAKAAFQRAFKAQEVEVLEALGRAWT